MLGAVQYGHRIFHVVALMVTSSRVSHELPSSSGKSPSRKSWSWDQVEGFSIAWDAWLGGRLGGGGGRSVACGAFAFGRPELRPRDRGGQQFVCGAAKRAALFNRENQALGFELDQALLDFRVTIL